MLDPDVTVEVIHPLPDSESSSDNANSVVVMVTYADRRILITGDIEEEGLDDLLRRDSITCDILLSPHHGSRTANTAELANKTKPSWVVASCGRGDSVRYLNDVFTDSRVLTTAGDGAVTFTISPAGNIQVNTFRENHIDAQ